MRRGANAPRRNDDTRLSQTPSTDGRGLRSTLQLERPKRKTRERSKQTLRVSYVRFARRAEFLLRLRSSHAFNTNSTRATRPRPLTNDAISVTRTMVAFRRGRPLVIQTPLDRTLTRT